MAQIALTFDLCVWDIRCLTVSAEMREELKSEEIALNGGLWWHTVQVCAGAYMLAPHQTTMGITVRLYI